MNNRPPLSVVIPSHRRADLLEYCLRSVQMHAPAGTEIIVVDDGSPAAAISHVAQQFASVRIVRHNRARGFCAAANAGIAAAKSEIVELLNDDTVVTSNWAAAAIQRFEVVNVAAVAPLIREFETGEIQSAGDSYDPGGFACHRIPNDATGELVVTAVDSASACAAFYRRSVFLEVGGFPDTFAAYFEDVDLGCRLRRAGYTILHEPSSVVWHHGSASYGQPTGRALERQSCNEERLFWRNTSATPGQLLRHVAVLAGKFARRLDEGVATPWLCGRLRAWSMMFVKG